VSVCIALTNTWLFIKYVIDTRIQNKAMWPMPDEVAGEFERILILYDMLATNSIREQTVPLKKNKQL